jgi:hypothetical protein
MPIFAIALAASLVMVQAAHGEEQAGAAKLADEFSDPLTTLPQIFVRDAYTPSNFGHRGARPSE